MLVIKTADPFVVFELNKFQNIIFTNIIKNDVVKSTVFEKNLFIKKLNTLV